MAYWDSLNRLKHDVRAWNTWRQQHPEVGIDLRGAPLSRAPLAEADLSNANLTGAILNDADLRKAILSDADLRKADLRRADLRKAILSRAHLSEADLRDAILSGAHLSGADLRRAHLSGAIFIGALFSKADLSGADLRRANLSGAHLSDAILRNVHLSDADLSGADLSGADLSKVDLSKVDLSGAHLRKVDLSRADLRRAHLRKADLSEAILCGIDFRLANLIETNFNGALLTDARLWASQRAGWSIQGVRCQAAYWDRDGRERTLYRPGEFERLYAETTHLVLHYAEGLSPLALATLPALIQRMEAAHLGSVLRLRSVHAEAGGATVTVVIDELGGHTLDDLQDQAKQLQAAQRSALAQADLRQGIEHQWSQLKDAVFPVLLEQA
jgi:uncharacterized protein YjbI with pentapeptide repeats